MHAMSLPELLQDERTRALLWRMRGGAADAPATAPTRDDAARLWWLDAAASDEVTAWLVRVRPVDGGGAPGAIER